MTKVWLYRVGPARRLHVFTTLAFAGVLGCKPAGDDTDDTAGASTEDGDTGESTTTGADDGESTAGTSDGADDDDDDDTGEGDAEQLVPTWSVTMPGVLWTSLAQTGTHILVGGTELGVLPDDKNTSRAEYPAQGYTWLFDANGAHLESERVESSTWVSVASRPNGGMLLAAVGSLGVGVTAFAEEQALEWEWGEPAADPSFVWVSPGADKTTWVSATVVHEPPDWSDDPVQRVVARLDAQGQPTFRTELEGYADRILARSDGGAYVLSYWGSDLIESFASDGQLLWSLPFNAEGSSMALNGDDIVLIEPILGGVRFQAYDLVGKPGWSTALPGFVYGIFAFATAPDGRLFACAGDDGANESVDRVRVEVIAPGGEHQASYVMDPIVPPSSGYYDEQCLGILFDSAGAMYLIGYYAQDGDGWSSWMRRVDGI